MTDYNDGNWHGWTGGECQVHPESVVDVKFADGEECESETADYWKWGVGDGIIAFRVTKPFQGPVKPREWWAVGPSMRDTEAEAIAFLDRLRRENPTMGFDKWRVIRVREVL